MLETTMVDKRFHISSNVTTGDTGNLGFVAFALKDNSWVNGRNYSIPLMASPAPDFVLKFVLKICL